MPGKSVFYINFAAKSSTMNRILALAISIFFTLSAFAITVKIENASLDLDAKDNAGNAVISVNSRLTVSGIQGKDFDLVAIVKDDTGEWHTDYNGNTVKTHYTCNATYASSVWKNISVYLRHDKLAPKPGKHTYKVFLYVYYNGEWYNGTYAGSYNLTGSSNTRNHSHSHSNSHSSNSATTKTCSSCNGHGHITCMACMGRGGTQFPQYSYYPFYSVNYVWMSCTPCAGTGQIKCLACNGVGTITTYNNSNRNQSRHHNNYSGGISYNYNYNNYNNNSSSSSSSSTYTTCSTCGGSGVCSSCHGTGGSWKDTGYYIGSDVKSWINCPSCNGNKKCFMCHGRGKY